MRQLILLLGIFTFLLTNSFATDCPYNTAIEQSCNVDFAASSSEFDASFNCSHICQVQYQVCMQNANTHLSNYYRCMWRGNGAGCNGILNNYYAARQACSISKLACLQGC